MANVQNKIGTYPYEIIERHEDRTTVLFYPKRADAEDPNSAVLTLTFNFSDDDKRRQLRKLLNELENLD